jgi:hypothetical protein
MPERFPIRVERFAVPGQRDTGAVLDDLGMLMAPGYLIGQPDGLVELEALTAGGSFCLLGEPGAGKTTALETIIGLPAGRDGDRQGLVLFVSMAEVTEAWAFREHVIVPAAAAASAGDQVTLVLDGLEECPVPGAGKALAGLLRQPPSTSYWRSSRSSVSGKDASGPAPVRVTFLRKSSAGTPRLEASSSTSRRRSGARS